MPGNSVAVFVRLILHRKAVSRFPHAQSAIGNQMDSKHEDFCLLKEGMLVLQQHPGLGWARSLLLPVTAVNLFPPAPE